MKIEKLTPPEKSREQLIQILSENSENAGYAANLRTLENAAKKRRFIRPAIVISFAAAAAAVSLVLIPLSRSGYVNVSCVRPTPAGNDLIDSYHGYYSEPDDDASYVYSTGSSTSASDSYTSDDSTYNVSDDNKFIIECEDLSGVFPVFSGGTIIGYTENGVSTGNWQSMSIGALLEKECMYDTDGNRYVYVYIDFRGWSADSSEALKKYSSATIEDGLYRFDLPVSMDAQDKALKVQSNTFYFGTENGYTKDITVVSRSGCTSQYENFKLARFNKKTSANAALNKAVRSYYGSEGNTSEDALEYLEIYRLKCPDEVKYLTITHIDGKSFRLLLAVGEHGACKPICAGENIVIYDIFDADGDGNYEILAGADNSLISLYSI